MLKNVLLLLGVIFSVQNSFAACPAQTTSAGEVFGKPTCILQGRYETDLTLDNKTNWLLSGGVFVGTNKGVTDLVQQKNKLTIEKGTKIFGRTGADYLVIDRSGQIFAEGTQQEPIVFTSAKQTNRTRGLWGGLILNGNAPVNGCAQGLCELEGEGSTGLYGGELSTDNSGILKYVVVEWAGFEITPDNELNGIAFQGVGSGTEVDYIQVHMNADDGVEFFGGTVNVKHLVLTGNKDDSLDWTSGWKGSAQFVIIQQAADQANHGIEADNLSSPMDAMPRSAPSLMNMTLIGSGNGTAKGGSGILLRKGTGAYIYNSYVTDFRSSCLDIDDEETFRNAVEGSVENKRQPGIVMENVYLNCSLALTAIEDGEPWALEAWFANQKGNSTSTSVVLNQFIPTQALELSNLVSPVQNNSLISTDYIGAVKDASDDWYAGWATSAQN